MTKTINLTNNELKKIEYTNLQRLNGARFGLEKKIDEYYRKKDGAVIYQSLKNFFLIQTYLDDSLGKNGDRNYATSIATTLAALVGREELAFNDVEEVDYFNNKKVDYSKCLPQPTNDLLDIYIKSMIEIKPVRQLEILTNSFFEWIIKDNITFMEQKGNLNLLEEYILNFNGKNYVLNINDFKLSKKIGKPSIDVMQYVVKSDEERKKIVNSDQPQIILPNKTKFAQDYIYGHDKIKDEFRKISQIVKNRDYFIKLFEAKKLFNNYLLVGPPGTGKTTLASNLAKQCGITFMNIPCVELCSEYFSKSAANVHEVYNSAKRMIEQGKTPGVMICFDEFDHIAKSRGYGNSTENDALITTLNENLDGGSSQAGIITLGITNVEQMIDKSILSRFKKLFVGYPQTYEELVGIHNIIIKKIEDYAGKKLFEPINYEPILEFAAKDERYKSGRIIDRIIYSTAIDKVINSLGKADILVNTDDLLRAYTSYDLEQETKYDPSKNLTKTR